jgi:hypothetical protein
MLALAVRWSAWGTQGYIFVPSRAIIAVSHLHHTLTNTLDGCISTTRNSETHCLQITLWSSSAVGELPRTRSHRATKFLINQSSLIDDTV